QHQLAVAPKSPLSPLTNDSGSNIQPYVQPVCSNSSYSTPGKETGVGESTISASLPMNLHHSDGIFIHTECRKNWTRWYVGSELLTSRIQDLNTILKPYANRRNYGPVFRLMTLILLGSITLAMYVKFGSEMFFIARIILILGALKCVANLTFFQQDFEKDIISQLNTFNQEDQSIKLAWKLQPFGTEPFFNLVPVPFLGQIRVEYASKETECDEVLPKYEVELTVLGESVGVTSHDVESGLPFYNEIDQ
ncbi:hypothetical protein BCR33DRAFT_717318, partial [Rhizoclosmatium globosum]